MTDKNDDLNSATDDDFPEELLDENLGENTEKPEVKEPEAKQEQKAVIQTHENGAKYNFPDATSTALAVLSNTRFWVYVLLQCTHKFGQNLRLQGREPDMCSDFSAHTLINFSYRPRVKMLKIVKLKLGDSRRLYWCIPDNCNKPRRLVMFQMDNAAYAPDSSYHLLMAFTEHAGWEVESIALNYNLDKTLHVITIPPGMV